MNGYWAIVALAAIRAAVDGFRIHVDRRKITSTRIIEPPAEEVTRSADDPS